MRASTIFVALIIGIGSTTVPQSTAARTLPGDTAIHLAAGDQTTPAIAQGGNTLLAVWTDQRANLRGPYFDYETAGDIYGMRLDANGTPLDVVPIAIAAGPATQENPKVSWNGTNWLVVFDSYMLGGTGYYYDKGLQAVRVSPSGEVLDREPITLHGLKSTGGSYWTVASDGNNWVVVCQGTSASYDIVAVRISPDGVVLDPPTRTLVDGTYYMRSNLKLAYAAGIFLLTYDEMGTGTSATSAVRFDSNLDRLGTAPVTLLPSPVNGLAANGTGFYIVWNRQNPDYSVVVAGSRVDTAGRKLDGDGIDISGGKQPYAYAVTAVAWDGLNWRVTWGEYGTTWVARVSPAGFLLDPGSVAITGPQTGPSAGNGAGGVQLVWAAFAPNNWDVFTAPIAANSHAGANRALSVGAPQQVKADLAASGDGYMVVYSSATAAGTRVLAQPLDAAGTPMTGGPVELDAGAYPDGPSAPNVAWSDAAAVYLVAWSTSTGVVAQRLRADGTKVDSTPFVVMTPGFGPADVAAIGDIFLIVGRYSPQHEIVATIAARVGASDGVVLDPTPLNLGGVWVARAPAVTTVGGRFFVAFHSNATHDNSAATTLGVFVPVTGTNDPAFGIYSFSTGGGNGIFEVGLASDGNQALLVQSAEITSGVENDLLARFVAADATLGPVINLTPWAGNQYRPRVSWDGRNFIVVFQDQKNRLAEWSLEQLDARSDLFGMRISATGAVRDPEGFLISASPVGETDPTIASANGISLLAASLMMNDATFANYRIGYELRDASVNQWPVAVATATPAGGDVPLTVHFSAAGSGDLDGVIASYAWDFGDGASSADANPSHTYTEPGPYVVTLTVADNNGAITSQAILVKAVAPNQLPVAVASADQTSGNAPLSVIFSAAGSYDPDGFIGNIEWRFSDGGSYWGSTAYHTFTTVGDHLVTLIVYDSWGGAGTTTLAIHVPGVNQPPVAHASASPTSGSAPLTVAFSSAGSSDPDGSITGYQWSFGDAFGYASTDPNPTYQYAYAGTYTAILTVTDINNVSSTATVVISVTPDPATLLRAAAIDLSAKRSGSKVTATGQVMVRDGNGNLIAGASVTVRWTRPDGSTVTQAVTTARTGLAKFQTSGSRGTYTLTVTDIYKYQYTFDPAGSVLTKSLTQ